MLQLLIILLLTAIVRGHAVPADGYRTPGSKGHGDVPDKRNVGPETTPDLRPAFPRFVSYRNTTSTHAPTTFSSINEKTRITSSTQRLPYASHTQPSLMKPTSTPVPITVSNGETVVAAVGAMIVGGALGGFVMAPSGALLPIAAGQTAVLTAASGAGAGAGGMPEYELDPVEEKNQDTPESVPDSKPTEKPQSPTKAPTASESLEPETASETYESWTTASSTYDSSTINSQMSHTVTTASGTPTQTLSYPSSTQPALSTSRLSSTSSQAPTSTSSAAPEETDTPLNWIDHDKVVAFTQDASPGLDGQFELRFNPLLFVSGGCDPYPAVDASGNLGSGLKPTGGGRSGCGGGGTGQVYVRRGRSRGRTGIMYSYYFPKVRWAKGDSGGHRHYWASIVVWTNQWGCKVDDATAVWPVGISFTTDHTNWGVASAGDISFKASSVGVDMPTHAKLQIHDSAMAPFTGADSDAVFERTLVGWDSLPKTAQRVLANVNYEKTQVPFIDAHFQTNLDAAYRDDFFSKLPVDEGCGEENQAPPATY